jgi:geranylgeranyl reductase family protein
MADTDAWDVLVVGLGPAGAAAATAAARAGARVLAIDRRASAGAPANCPEFIPVALGAHAHADRILIQSIVGARSHPEGGVRSSRFQAGSVVDRGAFDRALVEFSRAAGAILHFSVTLAALDADHSLATLLRGEGALQVRFRALVAADGHASTVARLLGMPALRTMHTLRYRVALREPRESVDVWISPHHPGGYTWLVPAGDEAVIGTGMQETHAGKALDALHRQLTDAGLVGPAVLGRAAGAVPVDGLRDKLVTGNVLFAGDAAGMAHPLTGAGIYPAVVSGEAAGRAAAEWSAGRLGALPAYEATMRGQFGETLAQAVSNRAPLLSPFGAECGTGGEGAQAWSVVCGAFD